ncbi:MAG: hypothetical protein O7E52_14535 [Candidatus Poribacteria bacterium]|nr:hypothetical protein [Candidatus Poribacteria bacterium]
MSDVKIKRKSWLWNLVPLTGRNRFSSTIGSTIYLTPKRYDDYHSDSPSVRTQGLVIHETVHVRQYQAEKLLFGLKYALSRKARLNYEIEAYAAQIKFSIQHHPDRKEKYIRQKAKVLSSTRYLLFMDYESVHQKLTAKVDEIT